MAAAREDLRLALQFADAAHRAVLPRHRVARWIRAGLDGAAEITVRIVGAPEGRELNRAYRGRDYATNVLTFAYVDDEAAAGVSAAPLQADLVLCAPVVAREARELGVPLEAHYAHLIVHGTLHAQGHDHEDEGDAKAMEARETEILAALGFANPYAD
jgi:probable rRNA maturation factor